MSPRGGVNSKTYEGLSTLSAVQIEDARLPENAELAEQAAADLEFGAGSHDGERFAVAVLFYGDDRAEADDDPAMQANETVTLKVREDGRQRSPDPVERAIGPVHDDIVAVGLEAVDVPRSEKGYAPRLLDDEAKLARQLWLALRVGMRLMLKKREMAHQLMTHERVRTPIA